MSKKRPWTIVQGESRSGVRIGRGFIRMQAHEAHALLDVVETDDSAAMVEAKARAVLAGARSVWVFTLDGAVH